MLQSQLVLSSTPILNTRTGIARAKHLQPLQSRIAQEGTCPCTVLDCCICRGYRFKVWWSAGAVLCLDTKRRRLSTTGRANAYQDELPSDAEVVRWASYVQSDIWIVFLHLFTKGVAMWCAVQRVAFQAWQTSLRWYNLSDDMAV